jgi:15-cis-phytoene synthase
MNAADAYAACAEITRNEARNFSYGIRLLPAGKRRAMCAVYAFARRIDDIGDGDGPPARKTEQLA